MHFVKRTCASSELVPRTTRRLGVLAASFAQLSAAGCILPLATGAPMPATTVGRGRIGASLSGEAPILDLLADSAETPAPDFDELHGATPSAAGAVTVSYGAGDDTDVEISVKTVLWGYSLPLPVGASLGVRHRLGAAGPFDLAIAAQIGGLTSGDESSEDADEPGGGGWLSTGDASAVFGAIDASPGELPPGRALELMVPVVRALTAAHEQGIVHRDLKPENVMLTDAGVVKVLDFGIAQLPEAAARGRFAGTLPYMSPEQLAMEDVDHRSDLWAAGIMLHELVTGRRPLAPFSIDQVVDRDVPMPSVAETMPGLGPLGSIIDRCLLKRRELRPGSARALLGELEPMLPGARAAALGEGESPFPGLAAFQETSASHQRSSSSCSWRASWQAARRAGRSSPGATWKTRRRSIAWR